MPLAGPQQSRDLVDRGGRVIVTVRVPHQPYPSPLLLDRPARVAHIDEAPDRVR
jgi:hypothetical protein